MSAFLQALAALSGCRLSGTCQSSAERARCSLVGWSCAPRSTVSAAPLPCQPEDLGHTLEGQDSIHIAGACFPDASQCLFPTPSAAAPAMRCAAWLGVWRALTLLLAVHAAHAGKREPLQVETLQGGELPPAAPGSVEAVQLCHCKRGNATQLWGGAFSMSLTGRRRSRQHMTPTYCRHCPRVLAGLQREGAPAVGTAVMLAK